jgi:hypothetical protein
LANIWQHVGDASGARIGSEQGPSSLKIWISDDAGEVNARDFIEKQNGEAVLPAIILRTLKHENETKVACPKKMLAAM